MRLLRQTAERATFYQQAARALAHRIKQVVVSIAALTAYGNEHFTWRELPRIMAKGIEANVPALLA
ncbi:MAG: hypothetical protein NVS2B12_01660 [Ktedonobacteraceae bacterium]